MNGVIPTQCRRCRQVVEVLVNLEDFHRWQDGMLIQDALPYLSADEREILLSRICGPCFDAMFSEEE